MKKKFLSLVIYFLLFSLGLGSALGLSIDKVKADTLPVVEFEKTADTAFVGQHHLDLPLTITPPGESTITLNYSLSGAAMEDSVNYQITDPNAGVKTIDPGSFADYIQLSVDHLTQTCEQNKPLFVNLTAVSSNAVLGARTTFVYYLDNDCPKTQLTINPVSANGRNGWYTTLPTIALQADNDLAQTFYQWNGTEGQWLPYEGTLRGREGKNVLYFYSAMGFLYHERIQSKEIKVDTIAPAVPLNLTYAITADNKVVLSWSGVADTVSYEVWRTDSDKVAALAADQLGYADTNVSANQTYTYRLTAIDAAGNRSLPAILTFTTPNFSVTTSTSTPESTSSTPIKVSPAKRVTKKISSGSSVQQNISPSTTPTPTVTEPSVQGTNTAPTETSSTPKNWSRLLLALSILIIAAGAAIGGYYGYEWWLNSRNDKGPKTPKSKSRW